MKTVSNISCNYIIFNDLHIGVLRRSGVTPQSQEDLRQYIFGQVKRLLCAANGSNAILLGDVFDSFDVTSRDWIDTYLLLADWCNTNKGYKLILVAGNHDISSRALKIASFETLGVVLGKQHHNVKVVGIDEFHQYEGYIWIASHHRNQELFDLRLNKILEAVQPNDFVLLHANYQNPFAERSDHSLNVSEDQALEFTKRGVTLVFAHEHQHRHEIPHGTPADGGSVVCLGNQIPTSVADCLGNESKYFWELKGGDLQKHVCWNYRGDNGYQALDWRSLDPDCPAKFIRVVGDALNAEAAAVIDAIHRFRQKSSAFVITNAVKIEGIAEIGDLPETFEVAKKFDVMDFVYRQLDSAEVEIIRKIAEGLE